MTPPRVRILRDIQHCLVLSEPNLILALEMSVINNEYELANFASSLLCLIKGRIASLDGDIKRLES